MQRKRKSKTRTQTLTDCLAAGSATSQKRTKCALRNVARPSYLSVNGERGYAKRLSHYSTIELMAERWSGSRYSYAALALTGRTAVHKSVPIEGEKLPASQSIQ